MSQSLAYSAFTKCLVLARLNTTLYDSTILVLIASMSIELFIIGQLQEETSLEILLPSPVKASLIR